MHNIEDFRKRILGEAYINGLENKCGCLCQRLKIKKQTVDYSLEKLKEEGCFTKTKFDIDLNTVGLGRFAWVLLRISWEDKQTDSFVKKLLDLPQVVTVADITGESDLAVKIFGPSRDNLSSFVLEMEKLFQGTIIDTKVYYCNVEYKRHYARVMKKALHKPSRVECLIMHEKMKNPDVGLTEIAQKHNLHRNTVSKNWKRLWEEGVLVKELPDLTQKGYDEIKMGLKAFIIIKPLPGREEKIIKELIKHKQIQDVFTTLQNEVVLIIRTENSSTLASAHRLLARVDSSIRRTNTCVFLTKHSKNSLNIREMKSLLVFCIEK
jgi:DNA-binding Lrp family transcriptional regulator